VIHIRNTSERDRKLWSTSGSGATSEPAVEVSANNREEPVVRNLPEVISRIPLSGFSSSDTAARN
jgi:hypothetical protein